MRKFITFGCDSIRFYLKLKWRPRKRWHEGRRQGKKIRHNWFLAHQVNKRQHHTPLVSEQRLVMQWKVSLQPLSAKVLRKRVTNRPQPHLRSHWKVRHSSRVESRPLASSKKKTWTTIEASLPLTIKNYSITQLLTSVEVPPLVQECIEATLCSTSPSKYRIWTVMTNLMVFAVPSPRQKQ